MAIENLITDHLDLWTTAVRPKSSAGRGNNSKLELTGIKKLRELILELAVRGKLVPQDPSDEPASVLLERIASEKAWLVKEGKIKKSKALPEIGEEEKLFELPDGWVWARLNDLGDWGAGATPTRSNSDFYGGNIPWFKSGELTSDYIFKSEESVTELALSKSSLRYNDVGDVLVAMYGATIGKTAILGVKATTNQAVCACTTFDGFSNLYLLQLLKAYRPRLIGMGAGGAQPNISKDKLIATIVALPPFNEQKRIVSKIDELMALCDQLELRSESQLAAHQTLVEALLTTLTDSGDADELAQNWARLSTHFDTVFTTEASIDALKQTILQLAVMGKLVPQDPSDEPAIDLFNRLVSKRDEWLIKEAKDNSEAMTMLRKLKKLTVPTAPFELPKAWTCAHLIQLSQILVDCHNKTAPYVEVGIPIIRTTNIRERQFIDRELKFVSKETYDYWSRRCPPEPRDIIFTREAPMGEALIIPVGETWCLGQRTMLIRPMHEFVSNQFLLLTLTEPHLLERASEHAVGLTVKHLRVGDVENLNIPLPPLAEQHRIVAKVDELMTLCDQLKARLQSSQQTQLALAESLVEGALA
ncbi:restriction endonuclease subunit S [Aeromonas rivipollensis]|uniref:restriction endonuclease subunit S n=1 Tax=Aeromonas rivipollensis TaxID=948519 RepID=UPI0038CF6183